MTLEGCWPVCKTTREYIRDPERIASTGYHDKLKRSTEKLGARFLDYSPETGSCSFEVQYVHVCGCYCLYVRCSLRFQSMLSRYNFPLIHLFFTSVPAPPSTHFPSSSPSLLPSFSFPFPPSPHLLPPLPLPTFPSLLFPFPLPPFPPPSPSLPFPLG